MSQLSCLSGIMFEVRVPLNPLQVESAEEEVGVVVRRLLRERIFGHKLWTRYNRNCWRGRLFVLRWSRSLLSVILDVHLIYLLGERQSELLAVTGICMRMRSLGQTVHKQHTCTLGVCMAPLLASRITISRGEVGGHYWTYHKISGAPESGCCYSLFWDWTCSQDLGPIVHPQ